jgi:hypothetical protein
MRAGAFKSIARGKNNRCAFCWTSSNILFVDKVTLALQCGPSHARWQLEARTKQYRKIIVWEDGNGSAEREIARLKAAGNTDNVEFVIVSWLSEETPKLGATSTFDFLLPAGIVARG